MTLRVLVVAAVVSGVTAAPAGPAAAGFEAYARPAAVAAEAFALPARPVDDRLSDYPRMIRLTHAGTDDGTLLVAADGSSPGLAVARSTDDGTSWSPSGGANQGTWICCAALIELPRTIGDNPEGTVLLAGTVAEGGAIAVWRSLDHGRSFAPLATVVDGGQGNGFGLWEPEFAFDAAGRLVCFFSDERKFGEGYSQLLAHVVSVDGGRTWNGETRDVAVADGSTRPGMARVVRVPDGSSVMAYEVCGPPGCGVYTRTSPDGDDWGDPADLGHRVVNRQGAGFASAPALTWVPGGGPGGRLVVTAKYLRGTDRADSGRLLMTTTDLTGRSAWDDLPAPAAVSVVEGNDHCANYSTSLLADADGTGLLEVAGQNTGSGCRIVVAGADAGNLPYRAPFDAGTAVGWNTYGGDWSVDDGALHDRAYTGQGDKAVAGSTAWGDVDLSADVRLDDSGTDAGLLIRANTPSVGTDALRGYVVGVDSAGGQIYLGRFDGGWAKLGEAGLAGGISAGRWYRVSVQAVGCTFTVAVADPATGASTGFTFTDAGCGINTGQIGVRTHGGRASWRALRATTPGSAAVRRSATRP